MASPQKPKDERQQARLSKLEDNWNTLFNQTTRAPIFSVQQYIEYLSCYTNGKKDLYSSDDKSGNAVDAVDSGDYPVSYLLPKLKLDIRMSYSWFLEDFVRNPNDGISLLLVILKNIQKAIKDVTSVPSKIKNQHRKRLVSDEHECLLCLKFCLRLNEAGRILLESSNGLENIASTLMSSNTKSRITALEIMSLVLRETNGFNRNLECFTYFRLKNCEPVRFKFLVSMLTTRNTQSLNFQIRCMKFLNSMLTASPNSNMKIFLQCELEMAGVDSNLLLLMAEDSNLPDKEELVKEILDFKNNHTDVDLLIGDHRFLQKQIINLKTELKLSQEKLEKSKSPKKRQAPAPPVSAPHTTSGISESSNPARADNRKTRQSSELDERKATGKPKSRVAECVKELEQIGTKYENRYEKESTHLDNKPKKMKITPCRNMPFLNWVPLEHVEKTVFNKLNYESVLDRIELFDLEETFKIGNGLPPSRWAMKQNSSPKPPKIRFMETSRAKNLVILQKRIGRSTMDIKQFILDYDVDALLTDNAELLLKFIPTEEEMRTIMTLDFQFEDLDDAEKMLIQLMSIERLEDRLKIMIFMDNFTKIVSKLNQPVAEIRRASESLLNCFKVKKIFEIILAIGNFLNGNRGGQAAGFRISSLPLLGNIRSSDRGKSLLDYVAEIVVKHYFDVHDWYDDLEIQSACQASFHSVASSMRDLSEGMMILERELQESQSCQRLSYFHKESAEIYTDIANAFASTEEAYIKVCALFGEDHQAMDSNEFFKIIHQFADGYRIADKLLSRSRWRTGLSVFPTNRHVEHGQQRHLPEIQYHPDILRQENSDTSESTPQNNSNSIIQTSDYSNAYDQCNDTCNKPRSDVPEFQQYNVNSFQDCEEDQLVETWIVNSPPPEKCSDVLKEECIEKNSLKKQKPNAFENDSIFDYDTASEDSAFVGSEGQFLRSSGSKTQEIDYYCQESSTLKISTPLLLDERHECVQEPPPDYSSCDSPTGTVKRKNELDEEITKVLNEFESSLNGFCSRATTPSPRRFFTVRSIIYL